MEDSLLIMDIQDEETDPFQGMDCNLFDDQNVGTSGRRSRAVRRDWGIPTFEDQIDRGICTFDLANLQDPSSYVTIALEHRKHSTGSDLWDSALVLTHNLESLVGAMTDMHVVELGSGTGAVGLYCSRCLNAKHVILTDLPENLELLQRNRSVNGISNAFVSIAPLDWTSDCLPDGLSSGADLVLGSDLCKSFRTILAREFPPQAHEFLNHLVLPFAPFLLEALAKTIAQILSLKKSSKAIIAYEERFDCSDFEVHAKANGLAINIVNNDRLHPVYQDPGRIHVLEIVSW